MHNTVKRYLQQNIPSPDTVGICHFSSDQVTLLLSALSPINNRYAKQVLNGLEHFASCFLDFSRLTFRISHRLILNVQVCFLQMSL